jgi:death-on-curing protein
VSELQRLTEDEFLAIRRRMGLMQIATRDAFGHVEPVDWGKFSSAVHRQYTSGGGIYKYKSIQDVGATLFFGISMGHPFENGNKRTALVTLLVLLDKNKYLLVNTSEDDLYKLAKELAAHEIEIKINHPRNSETEVKAVSAWLRLRIKAKNQGDTAIPFSDLKNILGRLWATHPQKPKKVSIVQTGLFSASRWSVLANLPSFDPFYFSI